MNIDPAGQPIRVLLVEDSPSDALLECAALRESIGATFDVAWVHSLGAAIERASASPVDVILLDLGLPDACGLETFTRAQAALPEVPVVVLSGLGDEAIAMR